MGNGKLKDYNKILEERRRRAAWDEHRELIRNLYLGDDPRILASAGFFFLVDYYNDREEKQWNWNSVICFLAEAELAGKTRVWYDNKYRAMFQTPGYDERKYHGPRESQVWAEIFQHAMQHSAKNGYSMTLEQFCEAAHAVQKLNELGGSRNKLEIERPGCWIVKKPEFVENLNLAGNIIAALAGQFQGLF